MEKEWEYRNLKVKAGLKPASKHFQYFFVVSEGSRKKCNYCVWIEDDTLSDFDAAKSFDAIVSSKEQEWNQWVKDKIDGSDFRNLVLKFDKKGKQEINLEEMDRKLSMD